MMARLRPQHHTVTAPMRFLSTCNLTTYIIVSCIPEVAREFCQLVLKDLPVLERNRRTHLSCRAFNKFHFTSNYFSSRRRSMDDLKGIVRQENAKVTLAPKDFSSSEPSKGERRVGRWEIDQREWIKGSIFWDINTRSTIGLRSWDRRNRNNYIKAEAHVSVDPCKIWLTLINYNITYISSSSFLISSSICLRSSVILAPFSSFSSFSLIKINWRWA